MKNGLNKRGPAPKPTKMKIVQGTYRADRSAKDELDFDTVKLLPDPPDYFDAKAREVWIKTTRNLQSSKVLTDVDLDLLASYCHQVSMVEMCAKKIKSTTLLVKFKNKAGAVNEVPNPLIKIYNDALSNCNRLAQQFGLTPSARTRISVPQKNKPASAWGSI